MKADLKKLRAEAAEAQSKASYRKALSLYEEVCDADPADPLAHHRAGELHMRLGKPELAVKRLLEGADLYAEQGFLVKAIAVCKIILQIDANNEATLGALIDLYSRKSESEAKGPQNTAAPAAASGRGASSGAASGAGKSGGAAASIALSTDTGQSFGAGGIAGAMPSHMMGNVLGQSDDGAASIELASSGVAPPTSAYGSGARSAPRHDSRDDFDLSPPPDPNELIDLGLQMTPPPAELAATGGPVPRAPLPTSSVGQAPRKKANEIRGGIPKPLPPSHYGSSAPAPPPAAPARPDSGDVSRAAATAAAAAASNAAMQSAASALSPSASRRTPPGVATPLPAARATQSGTSFPALPPLPGPSSFPAVPPQSPPEPFPSQGTVTRPSPRVLPASPVMLAPKAAPLPELLTNPLSTPSPRPSAGMPPPPSLARPPELLGTPISSTPSDGSSPSAVHLLGAGMRTQVVGEGGGLPPDLYDAIEISVEDDEVSIVSEAPRALPETVLFAGLGRNVLTQLADRLEFQRFQQGEVIAHEGEVGESLYVIADGEVVISVKGPPEREVCRLTDGEFFGEISVISDFPRTATVTAARETNVLRLTRRVVWEIVEEHPEFLATLIRFVTTRLMETLQKTSPLFLALPASERASFAARFKLLEVENDHVVVEQGKRSEGLFVLLGGRFDVLALKDGEEQHVAELGPGSIVGEVSLLTRQPASHSVKTTRRSWVLWMSPATFSEMLMTYPTVLEYVHDLAEQRRHSVAQLQMI